MSSGGAFTTSTDSWQLPLLLVYDTNNQVNPSKTARAPGSPGINTLDVCAAQRHFLNIAPISSSCGLIAADVNGDSAIDTVDVMAIQRFFLGPATGIADVGEYKFDPAGQTYAEITRDWSDQNYVAMILGDITAPFAE